MQHRNQGIGRTGRTDIFQQRQYRPSAKYREHVGHCHAHLRDQGRVQMSIALPARFPECLVAECPDAVIYADAAGNIRYWNAAATRTFGFSTIEAIGSPLDLIIPEWLRSRPWEGYNKVMSGAQSRYDEGALLTVPALHKDGRQISIEFCRPAAARMKTGSLVGIAAFLRDCNQALRGSSRFAPRVGKAQE